MTLPLTAKLTLKLLGGRILLVLTWPNNKNPSVGLVI